MGKYCRSSNWASVADQRTCPETPYESRAEQYKYRRKLKFSFKQKYLVFRRRKESIFRF